MSEMIGRVSAAIAKLGSVDAANYQHREMIARAAIGAMREPPPLEMAPGVSAYAHVDRSCRPVAFRAGWNAVIDTALQPATDTSEAK